MKKKFRWIKRLLLGITILLFTALILLGVRNYLILKQVHTYDQEISTASQKYDISEYQNLIAAIIFTESKGKVIDIMQSSESVYGEMGKISSTEESIEHGVKFLAEALQKAEDQKCDLWTAVQAYNFGLDYIDYVAERGGKNSLELAETYSRDVLSPLLGNQEKTKYRYWGIHSLIYNGGYLYHNGGNLFYAETVKLNQLKIQGTNFLF